MEAHPMKPIKSPKNGSEIATNAAEAPAGLSHTAQRREGSGSKQQDRITRVQPREAALTCENAVQRAIYKSDRERALDAALQQHRFYHICMENGHGVTATLRAECSQAAADAQERGSACPNDI